MKLISLILAFIVCTQVAIPCCAGSDHCGGNATEQSHSSQDSHDCDFTCSGICCGISFTLENFSFDILQIINKDYSYIFDYFFDYTFDYQVITWHPPAYC